MPSQVAADAEGRGHAHGSERAAGQAQRGGGRADQQRGAEDGADVSETRATVMPMSDHEGQAEQPDADAAGGGRDPC